MFLEPRIIILDRFLKEHVPLKAGDAQCFITETNNIIKYNIKIKCIYMILQYFWELFFLKTLLMIPNI